MKVTCKQCGLRANPKKIKHCKVDGCDLVKTKVIVPRIDTTVLDFSNLTKDIYETSFDVVEDIKSEDHASGEDKWFSHTCY